MSAKERAMCEFAVQAHGGVSDGRRMNEEEEAMGGGALREAGAAEAVASRKRTTSR